jgi:hypothetical protein
MPPFAGPEASAYGSAVSPTGYINGENALMSKSVPVSLCRRFELLVVLEG